MVNVYTLQKRLVKLAKQKKSATNKKKFRGVKIMEEQAWNIKEKIRILREHKKK